MSTQRECDLTVLRAGLRSPHVSVRLDASTRLRTLFPDVVLDDVRLDVVVPPVARSAPSPSSATRLLEIDQAAIAALARARPRLDAGDVVFLSGAVERYDEHDGTAWVRVAVPEGTPLDLERFRSNPIVLWAHDAAELPIGRVEELAVDAGSLRMRVKFDQRSELAQRVWAGVTERVIRGVEVLVDSGGSMLSASFVAYSEGSSASSSAARTDAREQPWMRTRSGAVDRGDRDLDRRVAEAARELGLAPPPSTAHRTTPAADPVEKARQEMIERNRGLCTPLKGRD